MARVRTERNYTPTRTTPHPPHENLEKQEKCTKTHGRERPALQLLRALEYTQTRLTFGMASVLGRMPNIPLGFGVYISSASKIFFAGS